LKGRIGFIARRLDFGSNRSQILLRRDEPFDLGLGELDLLHVLRVHAPAQTCRSKGQSYDRNERLRQSRHFKTPVLSRTRQQLTVAAMAKFHERQNGWLSRQH
jgi:hypothetical protein